MTTEDQLRRDIRELTCERDQLRAALERLLARAEQLGAEDEIEHFGKCPACDQARAALADTTPAR